MSSNEIRRRLEMTAAIIANECRYDVRHGRSVADSADKVLDYLEQEITNALEEAAKACEGVITSLAPRHYVDAVTDTAAKSIRALKSVNQ
jgi:hypothetical protein